MRTWTHIEAQSHAQALELVAALGDYRSCVVQQSTDSWSIYVQADPAEIANIAGGRAVDESELDAAGIATR